MSRFALLFVALPIVLLLAACGGSKQSSTTTATTSATTSSTSVTSTAAAGSGTTAGGTGTSGGQTTTSATSTQSSSTSKAKPPPTNARVPATFTVLPAGVVRPPTISVPATFAIELTIVSGDGRAHQAVLRTIVPHTLSVPPHGRASVLVPAQRLGQYALDVDGSRRATLLIGGQPGP